MWLNPTRNLFRYPFSILGPGRQDAQRAPRRAGGGQHPVRGQQADLRQSGRIRRLSPAGQRRLGGAAQANAVMARLLMRDIVCACPSVYRLDVP